MRSIAELAGLRGSMRSNNAYPMLMTLYAEAQDSGGAPFTRDIFRLGWLAALPPARVLPLLDELRDVGVITFEEVVDRRTVQVEVL